jgi:pectin lyase
MRLLNVFVAIAAFLPTSFAALPTKAEGFASSTTGGKGSQVVRPKSNQGLANYLKDNTARIVYLERTFGVRGSEDLRLKLAVSLGYRRALPTFYQQDPVVH